MCKDSGEERAARIRGASILLLADGGGAFTLCGIDPRGRLYSLRPAPPTLRSVHRPMPTDPSILSELSTPFGPSPFRLSTSSSISHSLPCSIRSKCRRFFRNSSWWSEATQARAIGTRFRLDWRKFSKSFWYYATVQIERCFY